MPVSDAQKKATAKYEAKAYDKILLRLPRGKKAVIEEFVRWNGGSVNSFINDAINEKLYGLDGVK